MTLRGYHISLDVWHKFDGYLPFSYNIHNLIVKQKMEYLLTLNENQTIENKNKDEENKEKKMEESDDDEKIEIEIINTEKQIYNQYFNKNNNINSDINQMIDIANNVEIMCKHQNEFTCDLSNLNQNLVCVCVCFCTCVCKQKTKKKKTGKPKFNRCVIIVLIAFEFMVKKLWMKT